ncbi:MAG: outer membrane beta-barrel protein [Prevotellaceae bacterium]|nr:outer membrane beta-barrel protein [Prevotellaceae bacterium]
MDLKRFVFFALLFWSNISIAAGRFDHEISGGFNVLSSTLAPVPSENNRMGMGFGGGIGYSCHFTSNLSLRTGLHANYYRSSTGMSGFEDHLLENFPEELDWWGSTPPIPSTHPEGYDYELNIKVEDYVAQQSALYLQLPLLLEFENMFPNLRYLGWYAAGGVKAGYAITGSSSADIRGLSTKELKTYLWAENVPVNAPEFLGFGIEADDRGIEANLDLGVQLAGYLEAGFKQQLTDKYTLYAGFFGEYCLYNVAGTTASNMLEHEILPEERNYRFRYNPSANVKGVGIQSSYFLSFGITVRIGFALSKKVRHRNDQLFNVRYFQF